MNIGENTDLRIELIRVGFPLLTADSLFPVSRSDTVF